MQWRLNFLLAIVLGWPVLCAAQGAAPASPSAIPYTRQVWRVADGLPEDTVQALAESPAGLLWIGTTGGLARTDGSRIKIFDSRNGQLSEVNSIFCLAVGRDGTLWAGTEGGGLLRVRGVETRVYASREGLSDEFVRSVYEDSRGRIWAGTDGGLFLMEGDRFQRWDPPTHSGAPAEPLAVHSITEDSEHHLWVGGSRLLTIAPDGTERDYELPGVYSENRVKRILQTADGTVWVGTVGGLQRLRGGTFEVVPGIHSTVRSLMQSSDGTLWIGTIGGGLYTTNGNVVTRVSAPGLLPSDTVLAIFEDDQKQIWIGTQAGLVRLNRTPVALVALPEGGDPDFETISGDNRGNVWVAAQKLYLIRDGAHSGVARPIVYGGLTGVTVRNVMRARDGALWIGTDGSGAYRITDAGAIRHYSAPGDLTNNFIRGFMERANGDMWIATDEGVSVISARGNRKLTEADGLVYFSTRSLLEARDGSVWIGTDRGLSRWKGGDFQHDAATAALAREKVWSILEDHAGTLWFGTRDHGLFRYERGQLKRYTTAQGLPTNSIYQVLEDRRGTFWVTGPNTIASVQGSEMDGSVPTPDHPLSFAVYSMPFGADGAQMYGGRQPSGYLASDDTVWFPSNRGAAHVTGLEQPVDHGPRAFLEEVTLDGQAVTAAGTLHVAARAKRVTLAFSAFFLRSQDGMRFRYKLENFDKSWNLVGSSRTATYTNLPAGHYRFRVVAFDGARPNEPSEVDLDIVKSNYFYETWWFYTLCGVVMAALAWTAYQLRLRRIKSRYAAVLEERSRMAREMHDTVIQGCTGISALLEAVASTPEHNGEAREELLGYARQQARTTVNEARQVVWDMRHEHEKDVDVVEALRVVAAQSAREAEDRVLLLHDVERLDVKASTAHEMLMTVREAVNNSIQHSGTRSAEVELVTSDSEITIFIADQGCGFRMSSADSAEEGHYGILGMRERMNRVGGKFQVTSATGAGTTITLVLPRTGPRSK